MKYKRILFSIVSVLFFLNIQANAEPKGYKIKVNAPFFEGSVAYLANYWEGLTYVTDSVIIPQDGKFIFESKDENLEAGQYLLYIKPELQIDFLIDKGQREISVEIDKKDFRNNKIVGSKDSEILWMYLGEVNPLHADLDKYANLIKSAVDGSVEKDSATKDYLDTLGKIESITNKYVKTNKGTWVSSFIKATSPIKEPHPIPMDKKQLNENISYVRAHYFDNIDLTDIRMWRTSFFAPQIKTYLREVIPQHPDTVANEASKLVKKTKKNDKAFEKMLSHLVNTTTTSLVMGIENTWAKLAEDYIFDKKLSWIDSTQYSELRAEYSLIEKNRIGMKGENLLLRTIDGDSLSMYDIDAEYLILYFYSPNCGYCIEEVPKLRNDFYEKYKDKGFKVLAINVDRDIEHWKLFMKRNKLDAWYNAFDPDFKSQYWLNYNTSGTPSLYLLDKHKIIMAKKLNIASLQQYLEMILK